MGSCQLASLPKGVGECTSSSSFFSIYRSKIRAWRVSHSSCLLGKTFSKTFAKQPLERVGEGEGQFANWDVWPGATNGEGVNCSENWSINLEIFKCGRNRSTNYTLVAIGWSSEDGECCWGSMMCRDDIHISRDEGTKQNLKISSGCQWAHTLEHSFWIWAQSPAQPLSVRSSCNLGFWSLPFFICVKIIISPHRDVSRFKCKHLT